MPRIGIFWVFEEQVIGQARELDEGEAGAGFIDTPDAHNDYWETVQREHPVLESREYFDIPRGRVLYEIGAKRSIVYLDRTLDIPECQKKIVKFFDLNPKKTKWEYDGHYTTDPDAIDALFE
jgi:hypothetical protein